jgi:DNA-damage-inducible protein J
MALHDISHLDVVCPHLRPAKDRSSGETADVGLTISDAVRMLLTRVATGVLLPAGLAADADAYDAWFRAKEQEALADNRSSTSHREVMDDA